MMYAQIISLFLLPLCLSLTACDTTGREPEPTPIPEEQKEVQRLLDLLGDQDGIVFHTDRAVGDTISMGSVVTEGGNVGIEGLKVSDYPSRYPNNEKYKCYTIISQDIVVKGDLIAIDVSFADVSTIVVDRAKSLKSLWCTDNKLKRLDLSNATQLEYAVAYNNKDLATVQLTPSIQDLRLYSCGALKSLDLTAMKNLKSLNIGETSVEQLDLSDCSDLEFLNLYKTPCPVPDMKHLSKLRNLVLEEKDLAIFDQSVLPKDLKGLWIRANNLSSLDVSAINLEQLYCQENPLTELKVGDNLLALNCGATEISHLDLTKSDLAYLRISTNKMTSLKLKSIPLEMYMEHVKLSSIEILNNENRAEARLQKPLDWYTMMMIYADLTEEVVSEIVEKLPVWKNKNAQDLQRDGEQVSFFGLGYVDATRNIHRVPITGQGKNTVLNKGYMPIIFNEDGRMYADLEGIEHARKGGSFSVDRMMNSPMDFDAIGGNPRGRNGGLSK